MPSSHRLTWADVPALLLACVSAITVAAGARLLRGQNPIVMLTLGAGVASATFLLEKLLVERLNAINPRQSLLSLLVCWLPLFLFATSLATVATFSWIAPEVARRDLEQSHLAHWAHESDKVSTYLVVARTALRRQIDILQAEMDSERRRAAAARQEGAVSSPDALRSLQRKVAAVRELERRVAAFPPLPLDRPADHAAADTHLTRAFRDLSDIEAAAAVVLPSAPTRPAYEPYAPPSSDLQSVLAEETARRSWRALVAWGTASWVELLPLFALWRGGRKVPLAARVAQWRGRFVDTTDAMLGRRAPVPLPIVIEPLHVRGVVRVASTGEYTLNDCTPLLEEAVGALTGVLGSYRLCGVASAGGDELDGDLPLVPQLKGEPLVLSVVEGQA